MRLDRTQIIRFASWSLAGFTSLLAVVVWASERLPAVSVTLYAVFPLLGLLAFSLMWTHYVAGILRRRLDATVAANRLFHKVTASIVLALILLHPGLLIFQLYQDGFGLPPQSYLTVYALPAMKGALMLGSISLLIFLSFEFKRHFGKKQWWRFIEYAQVIAMFLVFYHGLTLGRELSVGWYRSTWYFYGISLLLAVIHNYYYDTHIEKGEKI